MLRDLLASEVVPSVQLQTVFGKRRAATSSPTRTRSVAGEVPALAPASALRSGVDCVFVAADAKALAEVATRWAADYLPRFLDVAASEVQMLAPLTRVCQVLNGSLQERLNPASAGRRSVPTERCRCGSAIG